MSKTRPFFSIVIPTTRPHYLKYSLASVLAQTFGDFEVIVAFNPVSEGAELGDLPDDPRIKVLRAPRMLPMHENWDRGFAAATGQWVSLLGDDDCLIDSALKIAANAIKADPSINALLWRWGGYFPSLKEHGSEPAVASIPPFTGKVQSRSSKDYEKVLYGFDPNRMSEMKLWLPSIMRAGVKAEVAAEARARSGIFCHPLTPDYGAAAQILMLTDTIHLLDCPLVVLNHPRDSMMAASLGNKKVKEQQFYGIAGNPTFEFTVVQSRLETNRPLICETILQVRRKYIGPFEWEPSQFFVWYHAGLMQAKAMGTDTDYAERELDAAISQLPSDKQSRVRAAIRPTPAERSSAGTLSLKSWGATKLQEMLLHLPRQIALNPLSEVAKRIGFNQTAPRSGIRFDDILEFSKLAGQMVGRQFARG